MNKVIVFSLAGLMLALCAAAQANTQLKKGAYTGDYKTRAEYCVSLVHLHGTMTQAQFECGFKGYSDDLMYQANQCMKELGDKPATAALKEGIQMFNHRASMTNLKETCDSALQTFPHILKK